jgi:hypothetical protein
MAVRLWALRAGHPLPPRWFVVLIFVRGWVDPMPIVRLEGEERKMKNRKRQKTKEKRIWGRWNVRRRRRRHTTLTVMVSCPPYSCCSGSQPLSWPLHVVFLRAGQRHGWDFEFPNGICYGPRQQDNKQANKQTSCYRVYIEQHFLLQ